ncbi:rhodanese-like domain-containing protein [Paracoccus aminophilus]|uniref:Rhodanese n=1 Tax=Paracoccus aminophilus JCM 7686 TaxID=1367847 RepID=S5XJ48_PARAH|nr:rhodanese-like domain-containing protein [Paracoccus aminophilus]AGT07204.1 rhodanese [Paracoccus aminophilus JCM 7686]
MKALALALCLIAGTVWAEGAPSPDANAASPPAAPVAEPEGFRSDPYNAPVPPTLTGAEVIDTAQALAFHDQGMPFVDVYPRQLRPDNLPEHTVWRPEPHLTIPDSIWLWNTGYDKLNRAETARLEDGLKQVTKGDLAQPFVIFCRANCWMSWNAGKRAVALGYTKVYWYPLGTDGWEAAGRELVRATVVAR